MRSRNRLLLALGTALLCTLSGCGASDKYTTIQGLQEENKVLKGQVGSLQNEVEALKAEISASKATIAKEYEEQVAKVRLLHEERVKYLESQNSTLMLELGSVRQEKLTLQEIIDQRPRLEDASQTRFGIERTIWVLLVVLPLVILFMIASKYHKLRGQLNFQVVHQASTLRRLENLR
jgi:outer membrane murein-binding lipoprotein Lpp